MRAREAAHDLILAIKRVAGVRKPARPPRHLQGDATVTPVRGQADCLVDDDATVVAIGAIDLADWKIDRRGRAVCSGRLPHDERAQKAAMKLERALVKPGIDEWLSPARAMRGDQVLRDVQLVALSVDQGPARLVFTLLPEIREHAARTFIAMRDRGEQSALVVR